MYHQIHRKILSHKISFGHAIRGIQWALKTQPNYPVHLFLSILSLLGGVYLEIHPFEWLVVLLLITLGLTVETINTALEMTLDCISLERRDDIKHAKDAAAGAMLIISVGSFICACYIFLPYILNII